VKVHKSFAKIASNYRLLFLDAYGVLKNSKGIIEGVPDVLAGFRGSGIDYVVITNDASRSPEKMAEVYSHPVHGELAPPDKIISSGLLAGEFLEAKVKKGKVAYIGKPESAYYIERAGLVPVPVSKVEEADSINALVLLDDEGFDWFLEINRAVNLLRRINIPVVVANTDISYPVNSQEVAVAVGSLANMMENVIRKTFIRFGKPDTQIFSYSLARVRAKYPDIKKRDILMVGDTLRTDILGANKFGIDTVLVLSGNIQREKANLMIQSSGIIPTYICESITT